MLRDVVGVFGDRSPESNVPLEVPFLDVLDRAEVEEEAVAIGRAVAEALAPLGGELRSFLAEDGQEVEGMRQEQRAVMVEVVEPPVGDGRLRGYGG
jgi:hypothetical protein